MHLETDSFNSTVLGRNSFKLSCRVRILGIKRTVFRKTSKNKDKKHLKTCQRNGWYLGPRRLIDLTVCIVCLFSFSSSNKRSRAICQRPCNLLQRFRLNLGFAFHKKIGFPGFAKKHSVAPKKIMFKQVIWKGLHFELVQSCTLERHRANLNLFSKDQSFLRIWSFNTTGDQSMSSSQTLGRGWSQRWIDHSLQVLGTQLTIGLTHRITQIHWAYPTHHVASKVKSKEGWKGTTKNKEFDW